MFTKLELLTIKAMAHTLCMTPSFIQDYLEQRNLKPSIFGAAIADRMQNNEIVAAMIGFDGNVFDLKLTAYGKELAA